MNGHGTASRYAVRRDMSKGALTGPKISDTWNRVMECDDREFARLARKSGPFQQELSGFVVAFTLDLRPEVSEHARAMMVALFEIYREHATSVRPAGEEAVQTQWQRSKAAIADAEALVDAGESIETILVGHPQPTLMTLILGVLMEVDPDEVDEFEPGLDEDPLDLDDQEFWHLLAVMHTVVAVLDSHATYQSAA
jgi:hypothetical protein